MENHFKRKLPEQITKYQKKSNKYKPVHELWLAACMEPE